MINIKVLGPGCPKCEQTLENAQMAVKELGIECDIEKINDIQKIIEFGVMTTPALVIDGEVKVVGKAPSKEEIIGLLEKM
jgi:small redox-active disulfide protein 2